MSKAILAGLGAAFQKAPGVVSAVREGLRFETERDKYLRAKREVEQSESALKSMEEEALQYMTPEERTRYGLDAGNFKNSKDGRLDYAKRLANVVGQIRLNNKAKKFGGGVSIDPDAKYSDKEAVFEKRKGEAKEQQAAEQVQTTLKGLGPKGKRTEVGLATGVAPGAMGSEAFKRSASALRAEQRDLTFMQKVATMAGIQTDKLNQKGGLTRKNVEDMEMAAKIKMVQSKRQAAQLQKGMDKILNDDERAKVQQQVMDFETESELFKDRLKLIQKAKAIYLGGGMSWDEAMDEAEGVLGQSEARSMLAKPKEKEKPVINTPNIDPSGAAFGAVGKMPLGGSAKTTKVGSFTIRQK